MNYMRRPWKHRPLRSPAVAEERRPIHVLLSLQARQALDEFCHDEGLDLSALVEAFALFIHRDPPTFSQTTQKQLVKLARDIQYERKRRRHPPQ